MNDDALRAVWLSTEPVSMDTLKTAMHAVLDEDRADRQKDQWVSVGAGIVLAVLCPALLWFSVYGKAPLVRGGYTLMAINTAMLLLAQWLHRTWSRQALPGPVDTRSQLQKTMLLLSRQAHLVRTAPAWLAPMFIGAALIGAWVYQERSVTEGMILFAIVGTAWAVMAVTGISKGRTLDERRSRMERLLRDLRQGEGPTPE